MRKHRLSERARRHEQRVHAAVLSAIVLMTGCGETNGETGGGGGATTTTTTSTTDVACPHGAVPGPGGACMPVGIQGCADMFWGADNLCHPSSEKCPDGTIPKFDEGCVPVGVAGCASEFAQEGLCGASMTMCPEGTFAIPQEGCRPIDGPDGCGEGTWGSIVEAPGDIHVDQSAPPGGNGARVAPFQTIAEALLAVNTGGRVVIAAGTYDEPVKIEDAIEVVGRCPSMVKVTGTQIYKSASVIIVLDHADGAGVRNLEVGGDGIGILSYYSHSATIDGVVVGQATASGIVVASGEVTITHTWIHDTLTDPISGNLGDGVQVAYGADLVIEHSAITASRHVALASVQKAIVHLEDSLIEPVLAPEDVGVREGVLAGEKGTLEITNSVVTGARTHGVEVYGDGTTSSLVHSEIRDTLAEEGTGNFGDGILVYEAASVTLTGSVVSRNRRVGLLADTGAVATLDSTLVTRTGSDENNTATGPRGVVAEGGATVTVQHSLLADNRGPAFGAAGAGTVLHLDASAVERSSLPPSDPLDTSLGARVDNGANISASGSYFATNGGFGLVVLAPGSTAALDHCLIEKTRAHSVQEPGIALFVALGGRAESTASAFIDNDSLGIRVQDLGSTWVSTGDDVASGASPHLGVVVMDGANGSLLGTVLRRHQAFGMLVYGASASLTDCRIDSVAQSDVDLADQTYHGVADGLLGIGGSKLDVSGLVVENCERAGLLFDDSTGFLSGVLVSNGNFGLVMQGKERPALGENNQFKGKVEDVVTAGSLAVPDAPSLLPASPP